MVNQRPLDVASISLKVDICTRPRPLGRLVLRLSIDPLEVCQIFNIVLATHNVRVCNLTSSCLQRQFLMNSLVAYIPPTPSTIFSD